MRLYSGLAKEFIRQTTHNQITDCLTGAFFDYFRYRPSPSEVASWRNSLRAMALIVQDASLSQQGVILEYQLPLSSKRLDCMLCGRDDLGNPSSLVVELKQWEKCDRSPIDKLVTSFVGRAHRPVLHPSIQVGQYEQFLRDGHAAFHDPSDPILIKSCAYLHNYEIGANDPLLDSKFAEALVRSPVFGASNSVELSKLLFDVVGHGDGADVLERVENGQLRPSLKLMEHVAVAIREQPKWTLLDEQLVVFQSIVHAAQEAAASGEKQVILVKGGPGTGKSVLAINLISELLKKGRSAHYATGSRAFTETLWSILGSRSKSLFKYFNSYMNAEAGSIDVLICDEAHRIRHTSNSRFTPKAKRSDKAQIQELLEVSKVSVFFIDDKQVVRPNEIGSSEAIRVAAVANSRSVSEFELDIQFRCAGSEGFVNWVNNTLGIERTANTLWDGSENFDFQIVGSPQELESKMRQKVAEQYSARLAAGFCWEWSEPRQDGTLVDDVVIGDWKMPWDAKPGSTRLAPNIPSASLWATDPNGINQVGCVYNIQGFELDYIGVIWGKDLVYRFESQAWVGDKTESADNVVKRSKDQFVDLVKNTYRVLLSRGMKGCYVCFLDKETEQFVRSRMERRADQVLAKVADKPAGYEPL